MRRTVLLALALALALALVGGAAAPGVAHAQAAVFRPTPDTGWTTDAFGHTLTPRFRNAPYPHRSRSYTDDRVMVFVPEGYRPTADVDLVVHFHGHSTEIGASDKHHRYREQLWISRKNAVLIQPQGPRYAADSGIGKLEDQDGLKRLLEEAIELLVRTGAAPAGARIRYVVASGHSGGYYAVSRCILKGGIGASLREAYLHDALYGQDATFETFARQPGHRLVSTYQGEGSTKTLNVSLATRLRTAGISVGSTLGDADLRRPVAIARLDHGHNDIVRGRFRLAEMLKRSVLGDCGAPAPDLRSVTRLANGTGAVEVRWTPISSAACRGFRVYRSATGAGPFALVASEWAVPVGRDRAVVAAPAADAYYRVTSVDDRGVESQPSDTYGVAAGPAAARRVLVVDGFSRTSATGGSFAARQHPFAAVHGRAIAAAARGFDSASAAAVAEGVVSLDAYTVVVWLCGDQATVDASLTADEQGRIASWLERGGTLFITGSEVAYDLASGPSADRSFLSSRLKAAYVADRAASLEAAGSATGPFAGLRVRFGGTAAAYREDYPDAISAAAGSGAKVVLTYAGDGRAAALLYEGTFGGSSARSGVLYAGFPFETIETDAARAALMTRALDALDAINRRAGR